MLLLWFYRKSETIGRPSEH